MNSFLVLTSKLKFIGKPIVIKYQNQISINNYLFS